MAEYTSAQTTDDATNTGADDVDTSTNEESQETDTSLEDSFDDGESFEGAEDTNEPDEPSDDESADEFEEDEEEESEEDDAEDAVSEEETKDSKEEQSDAGKETEETKEVSEAEQKRLNDEHAKARIAEREARERDLVESQAEYLDKAKDDKDLALRQLQVDAYNNRVERNTDRLSNAVDRALANIDLFTNGTFEQKEELLISLDEWEAANVRKDTYGNPVEIRGDLFQFLQSKAGRIERLTGIGARQETRAKTKVKARTETVPNRTPKEAKKDEGLEAFDEEANRW